MPPNGDSSCNFTGLWYQRAEAPGVLPCPGPCALLIVIFIYFFSVHAFKSLLGRAQAVSAEASPYLWELWEEVGEQGLGSQAQGPLAFSPTGRLRPHPAGQVTGPHL